MLCTVDFLIHVTCFCSIVAVTTENAVVAREQIMYRGKVSPLSYVSLCCLRYQQGLCQLLSLLIMFILSLSLLHTSLGVATWSPCPPPPSALMILLSLNLYRLFTSASCDATLTVAEGGFPEEVWMHGHVHLLLISKASAAGIIWCYTPHHY